MFITIDKNGYVNSWSWAKNSPDMIEIDNAMIPEGWNDNAFDYKYVRGQLRYDVEGKAARDLEEKILRLKKDRELKCFPIINRGQLWYNTLTKRQLQELDKWYTEWLDAPQTLVEPQTPEWLK